MLAGPHSWPGSFEEDMKLLPLMECSTLDSDKQNPHVFKKRFFIRNYSPSCPAAFFYLTLLF
jgi:hypothetical protein